MFILKTKKKVALILMIALLLPSTFGFANNMEDANRNKKLEYLLEESGIEVIYEYTDNEEHYEILKTNDFYVYYEHIGNTANVGQINFDGSVHYYVNDGSGFVYKYEFTIDDIEKFINILPRNETSLRNLNSKVNNVGKYLFEYTIDIDYIEAINIQEQYAEHLSEGIYSGPGLEDIAREVLRSEYGAPYSNIQRKNKTVNGVTAAVYETMSQHAGKGDTIFIKASSEILVAVASFFIDPKLALAITVYTIVNNVAIAVRNQNIVIYKGTIYYDLDAKVKGTIWARAGKTITGDVYIGDK